MTVAPATLHVEPTSDGIVCLDRVNRSYGTGENAVHALRDISLRIEANTVVAIIGPSGSGKSTLLNLIGAIDSPTTGSVKVAGHDLGRLDERARTLFRRHHIGFVFQFFNLLPTLSALENVALPALLAGRPTRAAHTRANMLLENVRLGHRAHHAPRALSGGEMQRVAIARSLMMDPPLIVADEPTGNLDTVTGQAILELLRGSVSDHRTVVIVTHDNKVAAQADRIIRVQDGRVLDTATNEANA